jgi:hypothetical protein
MAARGAGLDRGGAGRIRIEICLYVSESPVFKKELIATSNRRRFV